MNTRRLRRRLAAVGFGLVLTASVVEVGARLMLTPPSYHNNMPLDRVLGYQKRPGLIATSYDEHGEVRIQTNSSGFRGRDLPSAPDPSAFRTLFVGDSFLHAAAIRDEDLMPEVLVRCLAERGVATEAYVTASSDFGTAQELLLLRRHAPAIRPDVVVLALYPANDVANNCFELCGKTSARTGDYLRPYLVPTDAGELEITYANPIRAFLRRHLRSFAVLEHRVLTMAEERGRDWPRMWPAGKTLTQRLRSGQAPRERYELFRDHAQDHVWEIAWKRTERLLLAFRDETSRIGAQLVVLVIPKNDQVQNDGYCHYIDMLCRMLTDHSLHDVVDWNLPEERLHAFFRREGIDAVFLLEDLRQALRKTSALVYGADLHLAARGHRIAGERVAEWFALRSTETVVLPGEPAFTVPVDVLAREGFDGLVRFTERPNSEFLAGAWGSWKRDWYEKGAGLMLKRGGSRVVLPNRGGDFVLRGFASRKAGELPLRLKLRFGIETLPRTFDVVEKGPFEIRLPAAEVPDIVGDWAVVEIKVSRGADGSALHSSVTGLIIQVVGLAPTEGGD